MQRRSQNHRTRGITAHAKSSGEAVPLENGRAVSHSRREHREVSQQGHSAFTFESSHTNGLERQTCRRHEFCF